MKLGSLLSRLALAIAATAVVAWLVIGLRDSRRLNEAQRIVSTPSRTPAQLAHGLRLVDSANVLNPERADLRLTKGMLLGAQGHTREGLTLIESATRIEPSNLRAWATLAIATRQSDPALSRSAVRKVTELDPVALARRR